MAHRLTGVKFYQLTVNTTKIRKLQLAELVVVSGHHLHVHKLLCLLPYRDGSVSGGRIAIRPPDMDPDPDRFHPEQKRLRVTIGDP